MKTGARLAGVITEQERLSRKLEQGNGAESGLAQMVARLTREVDGAMYPYRSLSEAMGQLRRVTPHSLMDHTDFNTYFDQTLREGDTTFFAGLATRFLTGPREGLGEITRIAADATLAGSNGLCYLLPNCYDYLCGLDKRYGGGIDVSTDPNYDYTINPANSGDYAHMVDGNPESSCDVQLEGSGGHSVYVRVLLPWVVDYNAFCENYFEPDPEDLSPRMLKIVFKPREAPAEFEIAFVTSLGNVLRKVDVKNWNADHNVFTLETGATEAAARAIVFTFLSNLISPKPGELQNKVTIHEISWSAAAGSLHTITPMHAYLNRISGGDMFGPIVQYHTLFKDMEQRVRSGIGLSPDMPMSEDGFAMLFRVFPTQNWASRSQAREYLTSFASWPAFMGITNDGNVVIGDLAGTGSNRQTVLTGESIEFQTAGAGTWRITEADGMLEFATKNGDDYEPRFVVGDTDAHYLGRPNTAGSWRIAISGNDLVFSRYIDGEYVAKSTIAG